MILWQYKRQRCPLILIDVFDYLSSKPLFLRVSENINVSCKFFIAAFELLVKLTCHLQEY
jgi:hypothetical protein